MSPRASVTTVAAAGLLALLPGTALAAPVALDDGSFEYPTAPANSFSALTAGQSIGPWTVDSGSVDLIGSGLWQAADGEQSVDLNGQGPGKVSQTFTTTAGKTYTVCPAPAGRRSVPPPAAPPSPFRRPPLRAVVASRAQMPRRSMPTGHLRLTMPL
ncbi:DUF642 domain-containing protein [Streptomyces platensis]|uniref:DUF642 domain-containing protein n=1 Tax=Streptomyces platensis TaxID=58346 RepID=UPI00399052D6